jgi:hypothetical protein
MFPAQALALEIDMKGDAADRVEGRSELLLDGGACPVGPDDEGLRCGPRAGDLLEGCRAGRDVIGREDPYAQCPHGGHSEQSRRGDLCDLLIHPAPATLRRRGAWGTARVSNLVRLPVRSENGDDGVVRIRRRILSGPLDRALQRCGCGSGSVRRM